MESPHHQSEGAISGALGLAGNPIPQSQLVAKPCGDRLRFVRIRLPLGGLGMD
jgi:hypothetical protein